jgi:PEP-CTERM motif
LAQVTLDGSTILASAQGPGGVPEPASWALMIAGFGLVGAAMRRRAAVQVTYA